jgi:RNA polymerase sigma factor (sigma-70 family)
VNPIAVAHRPTAVPDGVLVQEAAAGGRESYGSLYDRYSAQVYNYCLRLTGSPDDAADATQDAFVNVLGRLQDDDSPVLDFASYLFAAARNESYALMRRRSRTHPSEAAPERASPVPDVDTDPERAVLLRDSQEAVRQANATLAPRHREVLALREVAGQSYDQIGQIMGVSGNAAAQLIWRARGKLKVALTAGAVASVVAASEDCEHAQLLINTIHDSEPITDAERDWLYEHLDECGSCTAARGMLFEVAASYRAWAPVAVLAGAKTDMLARAGGVVGADWSSPNGGGGIPKSRAKRAAAGSALAVAIMGAVIAVAGLLSDDVSITRDAAPADDGSSAKKAQSSSSAKATRAGGAAAAGGLAPSGFSPLTSAAAPDVQRVLGVSEESTGGPGTVGAPEPRRGRQGDPQNTTPGPRNGQPRGGGPGTGSPGQPGPGGGNQPGGPGGGNPGGGPGNPPGGPGAQPGNPPGGGPGGGPGGNPGGGPGGNPGGGPGGNPGGGPGGGPGPKDPPPPVDEPPVIPPTGSECSWPGHGNGPGGCPPGHGGTPPGQGGTPPGQGKKP